MASDPFDAYIEFEGGNKPVGEALDAIFSKTKASEIDEFEFGSSSFLPASFQRDVPIDGSDMRRLFGEDDDEAEEEVADLANREDVRTFEIEKRLDSASPLLFQAYCSAAADIATAIKYDKVTVSVRKPGDPPVVYLKVVFSTVYVAEYSIDLDEGEVVPIEKIQFYFREAEVTYTPIDATGAAASPLVRFWRFA